MWQAGMQCLAAHRKGAGKGIAHCTNKLAETVQNYLKFNLNSMIARYIFRRPAADCQGGVSNWRLFDLNRLSFEQTKTT
jgi:hypothetical protein